MPGVLESKTDGVDKSDMRRIRHSHLGNALRWATNFRGQRSVIGRKYIFDALSRVTPSVAVDTDGIRIYLSTSDQEVSRETFARGAYERGVFAQAIHALERPDVRSDGLRGRGFLDIGANIGSATCLALSRYGAAEAWVFEPAPENLMLLRQNVLVNNLADNVHVHAVALSDHDGSVTFELSPISLGDHRVRTAGAHGYGLVELFEESQRSTVPVQARRLDSLVEEGGIDIGTLGLAWIDVQGHEGHLFAGAKTLLDSDVPIVCEYWPYGLERAGGLEQFLTLIAASRSRFIDLAAPDSSVRPTARLWDLRGHYQGLATTDLLLLP